MQLSHTASTRNTGYKYVTYMVHCTCFCSLLNTMSSSHPRRAFKWVEGLQLAKTDQVATHLNNYKIMTIYHLQHLTELPSSVECTDKKKSFVTFDATKMQFDVIL